ncbi:MAG: hypothetical protein C4333_03520 [Meiothermus sp.]
MTLSERPSPWQEPQLDQASLAQRARPVKKKRRPLLTGASRPAGAAPVAIFLLIQAKDLQKLSF